MASDDQLFESLGHVRELEVFVHDLIDVLRDRKLRSGENLLPHAEKAGVRVPEFLEGTAITWDPGPQFEAEFGARDPLVLVRSGNVRVLGLTIGCIRIGRRVKVCLECGCLWCRVFLHIVGPAQPGGELESRFRARSRRTTGPLCRRSGL